MKPTRSVGGILGLYISGFILIYQCWSSVSGDPCLKAVNIGDYRRSTSFSKTKQDRLLCDRNIDETLWYRFDAYTGGKIPESCVSAKHCGTEFPIWMNGEHPSAAKPGPKTAEVCAPNWGGQKDCCKWKQNISVRWCQDATTGKEYFVYQLKKPPHCSMSYCAGSGPAYPKMTGLPVLKEPKIIDAAIGVTDEFEQEAPVFPTRFVVDCVVSYPRQTVDDGARFDVVFEVNGHPLTQFTVNSTTLEASLDESALDGHLGKELTCKVSSHWDSSEVISKHLTSKGRWFGLQPVDKMNTVISRNLVVKEGEKVSLWVKSTFPLTTRTCFDNLPKKKCQHLTPLRLHVRAPETLHLSDCEMVFNKDTDRSVELVIAPIPQIGSTPKPFIRRLDFEADSDSVDTNPIFKGYMIQSINIEVRDPDNPPKCESTGDPHITTFPNAAGVRRYYHIYRDGVYYLVRLNTGNLEIQVNQVSCAEGVSCNCGVIAREGNIIIGIIMCNRKTPLLIEYHLFDRASHTGVIHTTSNGWKIFLPSGIVIEVVRWHWYGKEFMQLYVIALRSELTQYDGLCSASFVPWNSVCNLDCDRYRVPPNKNFFHIDHETLLDCKKEHKPVKKCTCNGVSGRGGFSNGKSCGDPRGDSLLKIDLTKVCRKPKRQVNNSSDSDGQTEDNEISLDDFNNGQESVTIGPIADSVEARNSFLEGDSSRSIRGFSRRFFKGMHNQPVLVERSLSLEDGREHCRSALQLSFAHELCSSVVDTAPIVDTCALDVKLMNDYGPSKSAPTQYEIACLDNIRLALETYTSKDLQQFEELKTLLSNVESLICPSQCSQNGRCVNSTCQCDDDYMGVDCSLKKGQVPVLQKIFLPLCDINKHPCKQILLEATDFTNLADVVCRMRSVDGSIGDVPGIQYSTPVLAGGMIDCNLPSMPINRDAVNNGMNTNTFLVQVSISNDGQTYSQELPFTVYDGRCMECPASQGSPCQLKENTCSIGGRCYGAGDRCQENDARICNPSKCGTKWSGDESVDCSDGFEDCN